MRRIFKLTLACFVVFLVTFTLISVYNKNKPQKQAVKAANPISVSRDTSNISFKNLESKLLNNDGTYYLWFCDSEDKNCAYVENEYIIPMLTTLKVDNFENMHKVNFTDCPYSKNKLKEKYNVDSTLAFVKVEVLDGKIDYTDSITWSQDKSFNYDDLKSWFYKHNLWQNAYRSSSENN